MKHGVNCECEEEKGKEEEEEEKKRKKTRSHAFGDVSPGTPVSPSFFMKP